jgi:hypothetical protein
MKMKRKRFFLLFHYNGAPVDDTDRGKAKYSEQNLSHCHFVHHKSHMDRPGIEPGPPEVIGRRLTA